MEPQLKRLLTNLKSSVKDSFELSTTSSSPCDLQSLMVFIQNQLCMIMKSLLEEKKQYERNMALSLQEMQEKYECRLEQKDRLIGELGRTIDTLISNSKQVELELSKKLGESEQEIQTYKNMLRRKYLREIEVERQIKKESSRHAVDSPVRVKKVLSSIVSKHSYLSPESAGSHNKLSQTREVETRASTLANRTSQLLSALKLRTNKSKQSAVVGHQKPENDSSIITINSTILPGRVDSNCEMQMV